MRHTPQFVGIEVFARGREARQFHFECRERPVAGFERQRTFGVAQRQQRVVAVGKRKTQHPDRLSGGNLPHETAPGIEDEVTQRADIGRELFDAVGDVSDLHANIPAADIPVVLQRAGTQQQAEPRNGTCQHRRPAVYDMSCRPSHRFFSLPCVAVIRRLRIARLFPCLRLFLSLCCVRPRSHPGPASLYSLTLSIPASASSPNSSFHLRSCSRL